MLEMAREFDPTQALACITYCDAMSLVAQPRPHASPTLVLEALAQACGMHVRFCHMFAVQVYVASMTKLCCPVSRCADACQLCAQLMGRTSSACTYAVQVDGTEAGQIIMGYAPVPGDDPLRILFQTRFHILCTRSSSV